MIFDADDERRFEEDRQRARDRMAAIRGIELAAAHRATEGERDDDGDDIAAPHIEPPPSSVRGTIVAQRLSSLARMLGLPSNATRPEIQAAIDQLSRADVRAEMRHRLGGSR